ncbi:MAG: Holliday junction resolvase RuvX [Acidimicrobiales bacterium]
MGIDLGAVRIGIALSDDGQRLATTVTTMVRKGDQEADRAALLQLVEAEEVVGVVVGLPLSLDGTVGPAARSALDEVAQLAGALRGVAVETVDERFTTVAAYQAMGAGPGAGRGGPTGPRAGGRSGSGRAGRGSGGGRRRRQVAARQQVDSVAAAILLQSWLDRRGGAGSAGR